MRRYVLALVTFGVTIAAVLSILFGETNDPGSMVIATIGMPVSVLLLTRAVLTPPEGTRPGIGSFVFGATVVPSAVLLLGAFVTGVLVAAIDPLRAAVVDLGNELNASSDFLDILFAGWAFFVIVELAVVAPLLEETLKPFGALVARPRTRSEALLFGAAAGAGFAAIENIAYASGWMWGAEWWIPISVVRMSGSALHVLGTALIALALFERRQPKEERLVSLSGAFAVAVSTHALWNGSIAVAIVTFAGHEQLGLPNDRLGWGIGLLALLAATGAVLLAALLGVARSVREGVPLRRVTSMDSIGQPEAIAAWALVTAWLLVPVGIAVTTFPDLISL